jgi:GAF domain-containing protein
MPELSYDLIFSATFVLILLAMLRFGKPAFRSEKYAYKNIIIGLSFLTGFSLIQLAGNQGIFAGAPLLEETAGRKVVEAILIAAGLIFLLSGISAWLPAVIRRKNEEKKLNKRYFCLKMISQSLDRDKTLDSVYAQITDCLTTYLGFERCAVYKYSARNRRLHAVGGDGSMADRIAVDDSLLGKLRLQRPMPDAKCEFADNSGPNPDMILPIGHDERLYGAIFMWTSNLSDRDDDMIDFMSTLGDLVGRHTHARVERMRKDFYHTQQTTYEQINEACSQASSMGDLMSPLYQLIKDSVGAEFMSTATLDSSGENMVRYTIGSTGRILLEKGVSRRTRGTDVHAVYESRTSIFEPIVRNNDRSGERDGLFLSCGMRSKLVCPVMARRQVVAVLTLGHTSPGHFTRFHLKRIEGLAGLLAGVVQRDQLSRSVEIKEDLLLRLQLIQNQLIGGEPIQTFFDHACDILTQRLKCTVARVSLLDRSQTTLMSRACRTIRPIVDDLREKETMPLTLLPWHRMAVDAKKLMLINQEDPESQMPSQESSSALIPDIKSAMLVPIEVDDSVRGLLSIGEARNWNRRSFGATDLIFAKDIAAKCSLALQMKKMEYDIEQGREQVNRLLSGVDRPWGQIRTKIKSPLSSIIGAAELLRAKGPRDELSTKYHDLILKSADRIKTLTDAEEIEETSPEMMIG